MVTRGIRGAVEVSSVHKKAEKSDSKRRGLLAAAVEIIAGYARARDARKVMMPSEILPAYL
jgi:hypothetical protein